MTIEQILKMGTADAMAWLEAQRNAFELVPIIPTDEMIKAAAGADYSEEDRELVTREWTDMVETHRHGYTIVA